MADPRIVSLIPAGTETVAALGLQDFLVGRSHECDYPVGIEDLPICSRPRYETPEGSEAINEAVRSVLEEALSVYRIDAERIRDLKPTHVITQSQCEVCAVSRSELHDALETYLAVDTVEIIDLNPHRLSDVLDEIERIGICLDVPIRARKLRETMVREMRSISDVIDQQTDRTPRLAQIEWIDPLMVAGHWMNDLIDRAGATNCFPEPDDPRITFSELQAAHPEHLLIAPCGYHIQQTRNEMPALEDQARWSEITAVRRDHVYVADGSHYFSRPGPRIVDSLAILAEILYPDLLSPEHQGSGWIQYHVTRAPTG